MRKIITLALALALVVAFSVPALAHGKHAGAKTVSYSVCAYEDCLLTGNHTHGSRVYAAHYYGDGHDYHGYCAVQNCAVTGYHSHDGEYCFARVANDGYCHNQTQKGFCRN